MKLTSAWQRLNAALIFLVLFLMLGVGFTFWTERVLSAAQQRNEELGHLADRVHLDFAQISASIRAAVIDARGLAEHKKGEDAEKDLLATFSKMLDAFPERAELKASVVALRDFTRNESEFHKRVLALLDTDRTKATEHYVQNYEKLGVQREELLSAFSQKVDAAKYLETASAEAMSMIALVCVAVTLVASIIALFLQSSAIARPLAELVATLDRLRQGDFSRRIRWDRTDEFGILGTGLNRLADDLSGLVGQVQRSGIQVNMTATEISATAKEQQSTATEIAATTAEIGATSKEISATSKELVKTMNEVSGVAEEAAGLANSGQVAIARMEATMRQIMDASGSITSKLSVLNEKTTNINSVVTTITKVADQTNLLSLNAAIEAEKAGEYGLGFAVVAMEIRRLADQTAVATYDIEKMVKEMQSAVAAGVMGMDKFSEETRRGVEEIRQVSVQLAQIIHQVQTLTPRFQIVNEGMQAQAAGAQQISETLTQLGESAQQTAQSLRQSKLAIDQLNEAARALQTSVARFKLESK
jgi:methyl-accepting chemotaxis protein WspA